MFSGPSSLVAHALREVDGTLIALLLPTEFASSSPDEPSGSRKQKVDLISASLDLHREIAEKWQAVRYEGIAHSRSVLHSVDELSPNRLVDDYAEIVDMVLAEFEVRFADWYRRLDEFLSITNPTIAQITRMTVGVPWNESTLGYFFERLERASWFEPLRRKHFFDAPAEVERDEVKGTLRFKTWPQGLYLQRIAAAEDDAVAEVLRNLPRNSNPFMAASVCSVAAALPVQLYPGVRETVEEWVRSCSATYFTLREIVRLVRHLAESSRGADAVALARMVLEPLPADGVTGQSWSASPTSRFGQHEYHEACSELLAAMSESIPDTELISMLIDLLDHATELAVGDRTTPPHDSSALRRKTLDGDPYEPGEVWQSLVTHLVSSIRRHARLAPTGARSLAMTLLQGRWHIIRRIGLDLLRELGPSPDATDAILDHSIFLEPDLDQECAALLTLVYPTLEAGQKATVLGWIADGPTYTPRLDGTTPEVAPANREWWQLSRLWPIQADLDSTQLVWFRQLQERHPQSSHRDAGHVVAWSGTTSPFDSGQIAEMSDAELEDHLRNWSPDESGQSIPSREGLGDSLSQAIAQDPHRFANFFTKIVECPPAYHSAAVGGLISALTADRSIPWASARVLLERAVRSQPTREGLDDPSLWLRLSIANLIEAALRTPTAGLESDDAHWLVPLVIALSRDQHPADEHDTSSRFPLEIALNTVRGRGLTTLIRLVASLTQDPDGSTELLTEVKDAIEVRIRNETVDDVLAALGREYALICSLDSSWATMQAEPVFGAHPSATPAWAAYLDERAYGFTLPLLLPVYKRHLQQLDGSSEPATDADHKLAQHVMVFHWAGVLEQAQQPFGANAADLFRAPDAVRAHAIEFVGSALSNTDGDVEPEVLTQLTGLWESRHLALSTTPELESLEEPGAFCTWFTSGKLHPLWALSELRWVLATGAAIRLSYPLGQALCELIDSRTEVALALDCVELLIRTVTEPWGFAGWTERLHGSLLDLQAGGQADTTKARRIANVLLAQGLVIFRDLA